MAMEGLTREKALIEKQEVLKKIAGATLSEHYVAPQSDSVIIIRLIGNTAEPEDIYMENVNGILLLGVAEYLKSKAFQMRQAEEIHAAQQKKEIETTGDMPPKGFGGGVFAPPS